MIKARAMLPGDRRYVVPTWAQSARYDGLAKAARFRLVDRLLDTGAEVVVLATGPTIHAWAAGGDDALHYAYVAPEIRRNGLARRAIKELFGSYPEHINVTHRWPYASPRYRLVPSLLLKAAA